MTTDSGFDLPERVNFQNLVSVQTRGEAVIDAQDASVFNLHALRDHSSAAIALLIAWFRYAHLQSKSILFVNVPVELRNIIELAELDKVLPLDTPEEIHHE